MILILLACTSSTPPAISVDPTTGSTADTSTTPEVPLPDDPTGLDPLDDLSGLAGLDCAQMRECAPVGTEWLGDTCCAFGDPIRSLDTDVFFIEGVDVEAEGRFVAACSGFGAVIGTADEHGQLTLTDPGVSRCQRIALGPVESDGSRLVFLAHHGKDTFLAPSFLWTYRHLADGTLQPVSVLQEKDVLYEGMRVVDGHLWVATHAGGLRSYALDAKGAPTYVTTLGGFANATKLAVDGSLAYVTDTDEVVVVDVSDPGAPTVVGRADTAGIPRDVEVDDTFLYLALGGEGLQVFRRSGATLTPETVLPLEGSIQAVSVHGPTLAVAAWDHLAVLERDGWQRVGGERLKGAFEETFGVALTDELLFGLEWYGLHSLRVHPGFVAPEVSADKEFLPFDATQKGSGQFRITNHGPLNALVGSVRDNKAAFVTSHEGGRLRPGESLTVRVDFTPPVDQPAARPEVLAYTNDPDDSEDPLVVGISAIDSDRIDVGEPLTEDFGFLDPTGSGDLDNLRGTVTVLAYFALF
ncbi:MAG: hypothetical protein KTR31_08170 [Myxococcales bacterium]|nr:hypothetical protein [Myxococcales bacterium]